MASVSLATFSPDLTVLMLPQDEEEWTMTEEQARRIEADIEAAILSGEVVPLP